MVLETHYYFSWDQVVAFIIWVEMDLEDEALASEGNLYHKSS